MNFYSEKSSKVFRFGDILIDFLTIQPAINKPEGNLRKIECKINISSGYYAVLSPCCSIKDGRILLCPLIEINKSFYKNPYFKDDVTRVNKRMPAQESVPPEDWQKLREEERSQKLEGGNNYVSLHLFVYEGHGLLPDYGLKIRGEKISNPPHMIDFRQTLSIICTKIQQGQEDIPINTKVLELSVETREELRKKLSCFYGRPASEDEPYLG